MSAGALSQADLAPFARRELSRRSLLDFTQQMDPTFERARHLQLLADHLEALDRREIRRLVVAMPPRHGKSRLSSQAFPAWFAGRNPRESIVLASYGSELAERNSRAVRDLVVDERYPFADVRLREDSRSAGRWQTTGGGIVIAAGIGSGLTGFGADLLIVDDPIADRADAESTAIRQSTWDWYADVARTRLHPGARQVIISTRWHEDDLVGRILESPGASDWTQLVLPAICEGPGDPLGRAVGDALWPERFPVSELPSVESGEISSRSFAALYQQRPAPAEGNLFKRTWFDRRYSTPPENLLVLTAVDAASKTGISNDWSAIVTVGTDFIDTYVLDVVRQRVEFPELIKLVMNTDLRMQPRNVYIEDASNGTPVIQELRRSSNVNIVPITPVGSKVARAEAVTPMFEAGRVFFP
jgi:hypothetical protein